MKTCEFCGGEATVRVYESLEDFRLEGRGNFHNVCAICASVMKNPPISSETHEDQEIVEIPGRGTLFVEVTRKEMGGARVWWGRVIFEDKNIHVYFSGDRWYAPEYMELHLTSGKIIRKPIVY